MTTATDSVPAGTLDRILAAQMIVAWAGEGGEEPRLGWWRTDLASEFGGEDLFRRLLPQTWRWALLQAVREAARRRDAELRAAAADPDQLVTLFRLGFELDERLDERLADLKRSGRPPAEVLPGLAEVMEAGWSRERFSAWVASHRAPEVAVAPAGRRVRTSPVPTAPELRLEQLVGALAPLLDEYPMPHYRRAP